MARAAKLREWTRIIRLYKVLTLLGVYACFDIVGSNVAGRQRVEIYCGSIFD